MYSGIDGFFASGRCPCSACDLLGGEQIDNNVVRREICLNRIWGISRADIWPWRRCPGGTETGSRGYGENRNILLDVHRVPGGVLRRAKGCLRASYLVKNQNARCIPRGPRPAHNKRLTTTAAAATASLGGFGRIYCANNRPLHCVGRDDNKFWFWKFDLPTTPVTDAKHADRKQK